MALTPRAGHYLLEEEEPRQQQQGGLRPGSGHRLLEPDQPEEPPQPEIESEPIGSDVEDRRGVLERERALLAEERKLTEPRFGAGRFALAEVLAGMEGLGGITAQAGTLIEEPPLGTPADISNLIPPLARLRRRIGRGITKAARGFTESLTPVREVIAPDTFSQVAGEATRTFVESLPSMVAAMAGGVPGAMAVGALQSYASALETAKTNLKARFPQMSEDEMSQRARIPALASGALTAALTRLIPGGAERLSKRLADAVAKKQFGPEIVKQGVRGVAKEIGLELPEEIADEFGQGVIEKLTTNPEKPMGEIIEEAMFAGAMAIITTGSVGGALGVVRKLAGKKPVEPTDVEAGTELELPDENAKALGKVTILEGTFDEEQGGSQARIRTERGSELDVFLEGVRVKPSTTPPPLPSAPELGLAIGDTVSLQAEDTGETRDAEITNVMEEAGQTFVSVRDALGNELTVTASSVAPKVAPTPVAPKAKEKSQPSTLPPAGEINTQNLLSVAKEWVQRINRLRYKNQAAITEDAELRRKQVAPILKKFAEGKGKPKDYAQLAALFGLTINEEVSTIPAAYARGGVAERTRATQEGTQPEGDITKRSGDDTVVQKEGKDRADKTQEPGSRPEDRGGGSLPVSEKVAALTPTQKNHYKGGPIVFHVEQEDRGPLEVIQTGARAHRVRELSTGREFNLSFTKARLEAQHAKKEKRKEKAHDVLRVKTVGPKGATPLEATRSQGTAEQGGVTFDDPVDSRDRFVVRLIAKHIATLKQRFPGLQLSRIHFVKVKEGEPYIYTSPGMDGFEDVYVDIDKLVFDLKDMTPEQAERYIQTAMLEELRHNASGLALYNDWLRDGGEDRTGMTFDQYYDYRHELIYQEMSEKDRNAIIKDYGLSPDDHVRIAAEHVAKILDTRASGKVTEVKLGTQILELFKSLLEQLTSWINQARPGVHRDRLIQHAIDIEAILSEQGALSAQAQAGVRQASGRKIGARIASQRDVRERFVSESQVRPEQLRSMRGRTYTQNQSTIGHARAQWVGLPSEVQSHLPFISERMDIADEFGQKVGAPQNDSRGIEEMINTLPEEEREPAYGDAYDNVQDLLEEDMKLKQKLSEAIDALRSEIQKPTKTRINDLSKVMARGWKNQLIKMKRQAIKNGQSNLPFDNAMKRIDRMIKSSATSLGRMSEALIRDNDPNNLDAGQLGISQSELNFLKPMADFLGKAGIEKFLSKELGGMQETVNELQAASDFMDNSVFGVPVFQSNLEAIQKATGAQQKVVTLDLGANARMEIQDPFGEQPPFILNFSADKGIEERDNQKAMEFVVRMEDFVSTPGVNPMRREAYKRHIANFYNIYLNAHFNVANPKLMVNELNLWSALSLATSGGLSTPEHRLTGVGSRGANMAMQRLRGLSQAQTLVGYLYRKHMPDINQVVFKAAKEHGITAQEWNQHIGNPFFESWQEFGSPHYELGDLISGREITKSDIEAIRAQKRFVDDVINSVRRLQTTQNEAWPKMIQDHDRILPMDRYALATSLFTMPRKSHPRTGHYVSSVLSIVGEKDPAQRARLIGQLLGGSNSPGFRDLIIGHIRSNVLTPTYAKFIGSPFKESYRALLAAWDRQGDDTPRTIDDVVDFIFDSQEDPETALSREDILNKILIHELGRAMKQADTFHTVERAESSNRQDVDVVRSDNFLTKPRKNAIMPGSLYDYGTGDQTSQFQILHSVYESFGQNYYDALQVVKFEVEKFIGRAEARIEKAQGDLRVSRGKAMSIVKKQLKAEQLNGEELFNLTEAKTLLNLLNRSSSFVQNLQDSKGDVFNEYLRTGLNSVRKIVATNILSQPIILLRNRLGGALMNIATEIAMGSEITFLGARLQALNFPVVRGAVIAGREVYKAGAGIIKGVFGNRWASQWLVNRPWAQKAIADHGDYWEGLAGSIMRFLQTRALEYEQLREYGYVGMSRWSNALKNYGIMFQEGETLLEKAFDAEKFFQGGKVRANVPGPGRKILYALESIAGILYELGITSLSPRGAMTHSADTDANFTGMKMVDDMIERHKFNALLRLGTRREFGLLARTVLLTPQELTGNKFATEKHATYMRNLWSKAGINVDAKMLDYFQAAEQARQSGGDVESVPFLTKAEYQSMQMVMAEQVNRSSFANRPEALQNNELGRMFGTFFQYPTWQLTKYSEARARLSNQKRNLASAARGIRDVSAMLAIAVLMGNLAEPWARMYAMMLLEELRETRNPFKAKSVGQFFGDLFANAGPFFPIWAGIYNSISERALKPGVGIGKSGISLLPMSVANDTIAFVRETAQTGSPIRPMFKFVGRYAPNLKIATNLLPANRGSVEYQNSLRSIRLALPSSIEPRKSYPGNVFTRKAFTDNRDNVINSLVRPGEEGPDWDQVWRERDIGIEILTRLNSPDPGLAFDNGVLAKVPFNAVVGQQISLEERNQTIENMSEEDRERLFAVESAFQAYASQTGRTLNLYEQPKKTTEPAALPYKKSKPPGFSRPIIPGRRPGMSNPFLSVP